MQFEFATAARILFGRGMLAQVPGMVKQFGRRALIVTGSVAARAEPLCRALSAESVPCSTFTCGGEPTLEIVRAGVLAAAGYDVIIGFGGGSAIDCAKVVAALTTNSGEPLDYIEVIGKGKTLENAPLPFIAIPTTAGTGAEVTRNAVLGSPEHQLKASLRSPLLLAKLAVVDPELTVSLLHSVTASSGLDALTQLIEPFVSIRANTFTDMLCREGLPHVARSLEPAFNYGDNLDARIAMSYASLLSGMALTNAGLGVVHGFAAPLGGMLDAPHGAICAALLPHGMAVNITALEQRGDLSPALGKYREIAQILTDNPAASIPDGITWVDQLCRRLAAPRLRDLGLTERLIPSVVEKAAGASSMKANPIKLSAAELAEVVWRAL